VTTEAHAPPTEASRVRRNTEFVRTAQIRYAEGFKARLAIPHPTKKNRDGTDSKQREPKWRFCEIDDNGRSAYAESKCPSHLPGEERTPWLGGFLLADSLCAEKGFTYATNNHPTKVRRAKPVALAEPLDAVPDTVVAPKEAKAFWSRHRGVAVAAPTLPDAENA
jgi:hypothetical protein